MADSTTHAPGLGVPADFDDLTFVEPHDVAGILAGDDKDKIVIIDVREEHEFAAGHIVNAKNVPSGKFADGDFVKALVEEHKDKTIVVHCLKSQQRGPTCGRAFTTALEKLVQEQATEALPKV